MMLRIYLVKLLVLMAVFMLEFKIFFVLVRITVIRW